MALFLIILFLAACSQDSVQEESKGNEITGQAVATEILRACKYSDGRFCEEVCCQVKEKCEDSSFAFMECDRIAGEWMEKTYADSNCISECEMAKAAEETKEEIKEEKITQSCPKGWKCLNKFEKIYRNADCSFGETERCNSGCVNDTCIQVCTPGNFTCKNDALKICDSKGESWEHHMNCPDGCLNNSCVNSTAQKNESQNETSAENNVCGTECFSITNFHYDAEGNDNNNENDEYVTIKNSCQFSCDLGGWEISDDGPHKYNFASFILGNLNSFTLYTGEGDDTGSRLYMNRGAAIWNNDGDTLYLKNADGELILEYTYP